MKHRLRTSLIALALLSLLAAMPGVLADPAPSADHSLALPLITRNMRLYSVRDRFGVGLLGSFPGVSNFPGRLSDYADIGTLGFGWYSDWSASVTPERPDGVEYVQLISTRNWPPNWSSVDRAIRANRGATWIIGNEPDVASQDNRTPAEYAAIYHQAYTHIKALDPTAQVAIGGVVMPSPLRLRWLEEALAAYQAAYGVKMPVDVWNIHVQILPEYLGGEPGLPVGLDDYLSIAEQQKLAETFPDPDDPGNQFYFAYNCDSAIFRRMIIKMREWLAARGERNKPLIISEYGVLFPSTYIANHVDEGLQQGTGDQMVVDFMEQTFRFMLTATDPATGYPADGNRLVQRWLWFSLNCPLPRFVGNKVEGFNGSLYRYETQEMTIFGEAYRDLAAAARAGTLSSLPRVHVEAPSGPVERSPLPPSELPDLTKRPPYFGQP